MIGTTAPKIEEEEKSPFELLVDWIEIQAGVSQRDRVIDTTEGRERLAVRLLRRNETLPVFTDLVLTVMDEHGIDEIESLTLALERIKNPLVQPPPAVEVPPTQLIGPRVLQEVSAVA